MDGLLPTGPVHRLGTLSFDETRWAQHSDEPNEPRHRRNFNALALEQAPSVTRAEYPRPWPCPDQRRSSLTSSQVQRSVTTGSVSGWPMPRDESARARCRPEIVDEGRLSRSRLPGDVPKREPARPSPVRQSAALRVLRRQIDVDLEWQARRSADPSLRPQPEMRSALTEKLRGKGTDRLPTRAGRVAPPIRET
jgi:hypothetical protein